MLAIRITFATFPFLWRWACRSRRPLRLSWTLHTRMVVYGMLALMTAKLFFPTGSELGSLLLSLATLGVGLVAHLAEVGVRDHPQECSQRDGLILAEPL
jgi:hypothetical protein